MSGCRNDAGKLFHILGPATGQLLFPNELPLPRDEAKLTVSGLGNRPTVVHQVKSKSKEGEFI